MKKSALILFTVLSELSSCNAYCINIDVYGTTSAIQNKIISCCQKEIETYVMLQNSLPSANAGNIEYISNQLQKTQQLIFNRIKALGDFNFIDISSVYYPSDNTNYTTIDVVDAKSINRIPHSKRLIKPEMKNTQALDKLLQLWNKYNQKYITLMQTHKLNGKPNPCPVLHCIWGFNNDDEKSFLFKLNDGERKNKHQLMALIKYGNNDLDRANAVFLLAHDTNYNEIANFLINYIDDNNATVRNNVMRVLGAILSKHTINHFPLTRIQKALDYPCVTDRNKAAYVLFEIVSHDKSTHQNIINTSGSVLIKLLVLKQPNNHDFAYQILKILSHQNYAETDIVAWENWIKQAQHKNLRIQ